MPDGWVNPPPNKNKGGTHLSEVENPGRCIKFPFQSTFDSSRYKVNCIPSGCVPVPKNYNVERVVGGVNFNMIDGRGYHRYYHFHVSFTPAYHLT